VAPSAPSPKNFTPTLILWKLLPWIKENLGPLLASLTEATDGEVVISEMVG